MSTSPAEAVSPPKKIAITLDDVRSAIGNAHPAQMGAKTIRAQIGRGSLETIQKHLWSLREERAAADKPVDEAIPHPPAELVRQLWQMAWIAARQECLMRLETLSAQRDQAMVDNKTLTDDFDALVAVHDALVDANEQARVDVAAALASKTGEIEHLTAALAQAETLSLRSQAELDRVRADVAHTVAVATRDAELLERRHQADREHLLNQVSALKSALHSMKPERANE